jgi:obg-like ATPase 1
MKPMVYAANVAEEDLSDGGAGNIHVQAMQKKAASEGCSVIVVSAQVESELRELDAEEAAEYLESLGVTEGGLSSLIQATYKQLGLLTYFTSGEKETRAWTVKDGSTAPQAAGVIHTDFEKGFIRAETVGYDDFVKSGGFGAAKEQGLLRLEGKEYLVKEGDIMLFRFNV